MKLTIKFALLSAIFSIAAPSAQAATINCDQLIASVKSDVAASRSQVLAIVEKAVSENSSCSCEIVKAAIVSSEADAVTIASIVEVVALSNPEQMRLVAQCAVAVAPDSLQKVQAVLAKLDPGTGDSGLSGKETSAKSGKEGTEAPEALPNPLDFPTVGGNNIVGPTAGGPGGRPLLPAYFPYQPPTINPPAASSVNIAPPTVIIENPTPITDLTPIPPVEIPPVGR
jgi:hypothetical protein